MAILLLKPAPSVPPLPGGCYLPFPTSVVFHPATGAPSGKRVYLFHGLNSPTFYDSGIGKTFVDGLTSDGHEVVLPVLPNAQACFFANGGWQYRERFVTALNTIKAGVETSHGAAQKNIVGGISYGGLHALMAAASTGHFAAWFAHVSVTRIDALSEFSGVGDVARFNPFFDVGALKNTNGLMTYATADTRVNYLLDQQLAAQVGASAISYPGQGHETTLQNVEDLRAWVLAN